MIAETPALPIGPAGRQTRVLSVGAAGLALVYLLPNHSPPWMFFLQETTAALAMLLLCAPVLVRAGGATNWRAPELLVIGLLLVVTLQALAGRIPFLQTAWMHGLYLLGLLVAIQGGAAWERQSPGAIARALTSMTLAAAVPSVALQLFQWVALAPGEGTAWVYRALGRPAGNLGQPNLLATVMVLALLGVYRLWRDRTLGGPAAWLAAAWIVAGLAMTQSRTGVLGALLVGGALYLWQRRHGGPVLLAPLLGLLTWLVVAFVGFAAFSQAGDGQAAGLLGNRAEAGTRPAAWLLALRAIAAEPLFGQGWGQSFLAQWTQTLGGPALHEVMLSAHNLVLDLALWAGLPVALLVLAAMLSWFRVGLKGQVDEGTLCLLLMAAVLCVHAMLEYPLSYAFFLLPLGLVVGAVGERVGLPALFRAPPAVAVALLAAAGAGMLVTVRDYVNVEHSYRNLLYEKARIVGDYDRAPPRVFVLTSLRDLIVFWRLEPAAGLAPAELQRMADVVLAHPSAQGMTRVAAALALNGQADAATRWIARACSIYGPVQCMALEQDWRQWAERDPPLRAARWPAPATSTAMP